MKLAVKTSDFNLFDKNIIKILFREVHIKHDLLDMGYPKGHDESRCCEHSIHLISTAQIFFSQ